ncbi:4Fe-4S dicluster domain-containing protein [Chloroflexus sp.]|uniref:4Fe-4S dicluster domain-containing protein n=1 Tax=Chloroflexus sp. TaxID=1904827 RepID=UPI002ADE21AB|nr:4Fe-4S dicluster domain-containing protein [Chloroflexus sp.]
MTRQPTIPLTPVSRRGLLGALVAGAGALAAASVQAGLPASTGKSADTIDVLSPEEALAAYEAEIARLRAAKVSGTPLDHLERMRAELLRALTKPVAERRWVMVIDLRACVGCHGCTIACVAENKLPPGVVYRPVIDEEIGRYPNVTRRFIPRPCMQCDNPPCTGVCPVSATFTNEHGVVEVDYEQCIGCRACIAACPYGARTFDFGYTYAADTTSPGVMFGADQAATYETVTTFEYGKAHARRDLHDSPVGNVRKCHFCMHRVLNGQLPACVTTCIGRATFFGDANDPDSLVSELIAKPNVMRLKEDLGTEPRVYYLQ